VLLLLDQGFEFVWTCRLAAFRASSLPFQPIFLWTAQYRRVGQAALKASFTPIALASFRQCHKSSMPICRTLAAHQGMHVIRKRSLTQARLQLASVACAQAGLLARKVYLGWSKLPSYETVLHATEELRRCVALHYSSIEDGDVRIVDSHRSIDFSHTSHSLDARDHTSPRLHVSWRILDARARFSPCAACISRSSRKAAACVWTLVPPPRSTRRSSPARRRRGIAGVVLRCHPDCHTPDGPRPR
jgi:hypothetical protein